jgi:hypothetical protein
MVELAVPLLGGQIHSGHGSNVMRLRSREGGGDMKGNVVATRGGEGL